MKEQDYKNELEEIFKKDEKLQKLYSKLEYATAYGRSTGSLEETTREEIETRKQELEEEFKLTQEGYIAVTLKSLDKDSYPDKTIACKLIPNDKIKEYVDSIRSDFKFCATKTAPVEARKGVVGESIITTLIVNYEDEDYILSEVTNKVGETKLEDGTIMPDIVVTNKNSTSNEQYIVRANKFEKMYTPNSDGTYTPNPETREFTQVNENIVIMTSWGEPAVCLKGSFIVTYDADRNDFNTVDLGAYNSTYEYQSSKSKTI